MAAVTDSKRKFDLIRLRSAPWQAKAQLAHKGLSKVAHCSVSLLLRISVNVQQS